MRPCCDRRARRRAAIGQFLRGEVGGPWSILATTYARFHGPRFVPYEVDLAGDQSRVRAGEALDLATEPIRKPITKVEIHPPAVLPAGFIFKDGVLLASSIFRVRDGGTYDHSGKYAALAAFSYEAA